MTFLRFDIRVLPFAIALLALPAIAQVPDSPSPVAPAPAQTPQTAPAQAQKPAVPDYPDPRTITVGVFYWLTGPGTDPNLLTGRAATDLETLNDLGKPHKSPDVQIDVPITRTGQLRFEGFLTKGTGNQTSTTSTDLFGTQFNVGDKLSTQYQITGAKLYLEDLLFPHKFPVAKFRVRSLWEVQFVQIKSTIDAPLVTAGETGTGTQKLIFPTFGLAAEYALTPHILLRAAGSGFGLYHKADLWDGEATVSYRRGPIEIVGGGKAFHFKTSPNSTEYVTATLTGAFVGLRWHLSIF